MKLRNVTGILWLGLAFVAWAEPARPECPERPERPERLGGGDHQGRDERGKPKGDMFAHMLSSLDSDKDGSISFVEFAAGERISNLPEEYQKKLFARLDKDADGQIRREEIPRGSGHGGPRPPHVDLDTDGDGRVNFPEFQKNPRIADLEEGQQRKVFDRMDRDKDGFLDGKDWRGGRPSGPRRPHHRGGPPFEELDQDKNGTVSFDEFRNSPPMKNQDEARQKEMFERMDRNGNGSLEKNEVQPEQRPKRQRPPQEPKAP